MTDPQFVSRAPARRLGDLASEVGATVDAAFADRLVENAAPLESAGPGDVAFLDNPRYLAQLSQTRAAGCFVAPRNADRVPEGVAALVAAEPYRAFARALALFFPDAMRPAGAFGPGGQGTGGHVDPSARLEPGVVVEPGAVVGPRAEVGAGTVIGANSVVGHDVRIGRNCAIGPSATVLHALIGNRVILHPGVRIGQDGFGFVMGAAGHLKVPQVGRVVIQDDVEIGANTTVDRGATRDTVIGEGSKIDNQVQIAHNVVLGRHCVVVAQVGISGSATLGDFVAVGGQSGIIGHVSIGDGAQIATVSAVEADVPAGARYGGVPARPVRQWLREMTALRKLAERYNEKSGRQS